MDISKIEELFNCRFSDDEEVVENGVIKFVEYIDNFGFIGYVKDGENVVLMLEAAYDELVPLRHYEVDVLAKGILDSAYCSGVFRQHRFLPDDAAEQYQIYKEKKRMEKEQEQQLKDKRQRYQQYIILKKEFEGEKA
ncbi:hypothetical protein GH892_02520 [Bacillus thuringiensis]|uniref:hypothetical protein n=1 Tax=Bacillus toyonensis TaxID=155322 RepID=UPI001298927E|nr:hypothetical protein [Bacillus thuringiensis]